MRSSNQPPPHDNEGCRITVTEPTEAEVLQYFTALSNADRWGDDDKLGTLNFITNEKRVAASRLVRTGAVVSLAWEFDTSVKENDPIPPTRVMLNLGQGIRTDNDSDDRRPPQRRRQGFASDLLGMAYHGSRITHIDALAHVSWDGKLYNNYLVEAAVTPSEGARVLDVRAAQSIVTRGILLDVPRHRGIDWMPEGDLIGPDEVAEILSKTGLEAEPGDALFLRTGNGRRMIEEGFGHLGSIPGPGGFHVACMPFFHEKEVAVIGSDMANDRNKSEYQAIPNPVHAVALTALGLWITDNCNLEPLARACDEHGTSEFEIVMSAIPFIGATGSPVNPVAVF